MIIDFHSHILPGIDDGSRDVDMSSEMLQMAADQNVEVMVATPHFYADRTTMTRFLEKRQRAYEQIEYVAQSKNVHIVCGAEVAFFPGMSRAEGIENLRIGDSHFMLVEMPFRAWSERDIVEIEHLCHLGIVPIIAHLERFYQFQKDKSLIPELIEMPVIVQLNAECLLSWRTRHQPLKLFKQGQAQLLGSDCHNTTTRQPNLAAGRQILEKHFGPDLLRNMDGFGEHLLREMVTATTI